MKKKLILVPMVLMLLFTGCKYSAKENNFESKNVYEIVKTTAASLLDQKDLSIDYNIKFFNMSFEGNLTGDKIPNKDGLKMAVYNLPKDLIDNPNIKKENDNYKVSFYLNQSRANSLLSQFSQPYKVEQMKIDLTYDLSGNIQKANIDGKINGQQIVIESTFKAL